MPVSFHAGMPCSGDKLRSSSAAAPQRQRMKLRLSSVTRAHSAFSSKLHSELPVIRPKSRCQYEPQLRQLTKAMLPPVKLAAA